MGPLRPTGFAGVLIAVALLHGLDPVAAQQSAACDELDGFHRLDFWVGEWGVVAGDERVGTNRIEKILDGCAILEHWRDNGGSEGKSLFYYNHATDTWRQVWVT